MYTFWTSSTEWYTLHNFPYQYSFKTSSFFFIDVNIPLCDNIVVYIVSCWWKLYLLRISALELMQVKYLCSLFLFSFSHYLMLFKIVLLNDWRVSCLIHPLAIPGTSECQLHTQSSVNAPRLQNAGLNSPWPWAQHCILGQDLLRLWQPAW